MAEPVSYHFDGHITAEGPIAVSYFGLDERLPRTPHGQVFLNGGTLRGALRKAGLVMLIRELAKVRGQSQEAIFKRAEMYMLGEGVDITRQVNSEIKGASYDPRAEAHLRKMNPFLSLFGRWKLAGYLEVSAMLTSQDNLITAGQGTRHDQFEHDPSLVKYLNTEEQEALMSEMRSARDSMVEIEAIRGQVRELRAQSRRTESVDGKKEIAAQIRDLEALEKETRLAREGSDESIKHPIQGYEAIAPGSQLSSHLRIVEGHADVLGLLLHCLAEFSQRPRLGGHLAAGFGAIQAEWDVWQRNPGERRGHVIGNVQLDEMGIVLEGEALEEAWAAFEHGLPRYNFDLFTLKEARECWKKEA